jgi:hypothetical protein
MAVLSQPACIGTSPVPGDGQARRRCWGELFNEAVRNSYKLASDRRGPTEGTLRPSALGRLELAVADLAPPPGEHLLDVVRLRPTAPSEPAPSTKAWD